MFLNREFLVLCCVIIDSNNTKSQTNIISSHCTVLYVCVLHTDQMQDLRKHECSGHDIIVSRASHNTFVKCGVNTFEIPNKK